MNIIVFPSKLCYCNTIWWRSEFGLISAVYSCTNSRQTSRHGAPHSWKWLQIFFLYKFKY